MPPFALGIDVDRPSVPRAETVEQGAFVPVGRALARDAGFIVPVVLTAAAHADCVAWSDEDSDRKGVCQDETGRLWDVLCMVRFAVRRAEHGAQECVAKVVRVPRCGPVQTPRPAVLIARVGPGSRGEVVLTVRLLGE